MGPPPKGKSPVERRAERPGELRAIKILRIMERVERDPDLAIDLRSAWGTLPELAQRYAELLLDEGVLDDEAAARGLAVSPDELAPAIRALEDVLASVSG